MTEKSAVTDRSAVKVLVTGGSQGIGLGLARGFAEAGAVVAISGRSEDTLRRAADAMHRDGLVVHAIVADVADRASCALMAATAESVLGGLDVLCANAGIYPECGLDEMEEHDVAAIMATNVAGTIFAVQACRAALKASGRGRVVITSSITGPVTGYPGLSHYGASKAAQLGFMRTAAIELAPAKITVNAILPGNIMTEGLAEMGEEYIAGMTRAIPAGVLGTPADIGHLAAFLASREAGYITGQAIAVDGGQVLPESPDAVRP